MPGWSGQSESPSSPQREIEAVGGRHAEQELVARAALLDDAGIRRRAEQVLVFAEQAGRHLVGRLPGECAAEAGRFEAAAGRIGGKAARHRLRRAYSVVGPEIVGRGGGKARTAG